MSRSPWMVGVVAVACWWAGGHSAASAQAPRELTNSIGMKLVLIPQGTFTMGRPIGEETAGNDETQHTVTIGRAFYLGKTEVTQGQYHQVMRSNPSFFQTGVIEDSAMHPVETVSWIDAVEFCRRLSALPAEQAAGRKYRLPTEAEWEYACRAGTRTGYGFGSNAASMADFGWYEENSDSATHPVGLKKPNAWGLHDLHGNVWEWCSDWYDEYPKGPVTDPTGPVKGSERMLRGGSWEDHVSMCQSPYRVRGLPVSRGSTIGFRVAVSSAGR